MTMTVEQDSSDPRALATALIQRNLPDGGAYLGGTAVAIGGGYFLSAGHVFYPASTPNTLKSAQSFEFMVGHGLQTSHSALISAPDFAGNIQNLGWGESGTDVAIIHTDDATAIDLPMLVYADPSDAEGSLSTFGFPSQGGFDGATIVQEDGTQSTNGHINVTLADGQVFDVLVSSAGAQVFGGQSGSGVWLTNDVDGDGRLETYLAGIVTLDIALPIGQPAIGYEPLGDVYAALAEMLANTGESADAFARATLVSGQTLGSAETSVTGSLLHEDLIGSVNADILSGLGGDDVLFGQEANDTLDGGAGNDRLWGDAGTDRLIDGAGKDNLYGGAGGDTFVLTADGEADAIKDFDTSQDLIDVSAWGATSFADLLITTHSTGKSILRYGAEATSLNDGAWTLSADQFTADHFIFAAQASVTILQGTNGNDRLFGTGANEDLRDGAGIDNLWGRGGADIFTLAADDRPDAIKDFQDGLDRIDVSAWGVTRFEDLTIYDHSTGKTILLYGREALSINDGFWTLPASSFTADDFIFA